MPHLFEKHAQKGNEFINDLSKALYIPDDKAKAGRILRSVFRALRNRITIQESFQLLAQLPMALKAVYVDGWSPFHHPPMGKIKHVEEFLGEVLKKDQLTAFEDFSFDLAEVRRIVSTVFILLGKHISSGEFKDIMSVLPTEIGAFIKESIQE